MLISEINRIFGLSSHSHIIIKDPRITILAPLYIKTLTEMGFDLRVIFIDRNFHDICESLDRAQSYMFERISAKNKIKICEKYKKLGTEIATYHDKFLYIDFHKFIKGDQEILDNIENFIEEKLDPISIDSFIHNHQL